MTEQAIQEVMRLVRAYKNARGRYSQRTAFPAVEAAVREAIRVAVERKKALAKPSVPNPCTICGIHIFGSCIGTGDGTMKDGGQFAHPDCYWRQRAEKAEAQAKAELADEVAASILAVATSDANSATETQ